MQNKRKELIITSKEDTYNQQRNKGKLSVGMGSFVFFSCGLGFSLFVNQYFFVKGGLILSTLMTALIISLVGFGFNLLFQVANHLEKNDKKIKIETMEQMATLVQGRWFDYLTKILVFMYNQVTVYIAGLLITHFLLSNYPSDFWLSKDVADLLIKLVFCLYLLLLILLIRIPESLKYVSIISAALFALLVVLAWSLNLIKTVNSSLPDFSLFNLSYSIDVFRSVFFSIENIGIVMGIRDTLKQPKRIRTVMIIGFFGIFLVFVVNGISFLMVRLLEFWRQECRTDGFESLQIKPTYENTYLKCLYCSSYQLILLSTF